MRTVTAYVEFDPETKLYVGVVPGIRGAHTQGATLDELQANLREVVELCLEVTRLSLDEIPRLVGLQQVEVAV
jgi:predicted RNase H-like HicB family nuclease